MDDANVFLNISPGVLKELGIEYAAVIPTPEIRFSPEVRKMCEDNKCGRYGTNWACPPGIGTLEECKERCLKYANCCVLSTAYELEDSFDFEGMMEGHAAFGAAMRKLRTLTEGDFLMLSVEGCRKCAKCTYPDAPCRFKETLLGSLEGYGIFVNELAATAGIPYRKGSASVSYFGAVFF